jgi:hypothetical protein
MEGLPASIFKVVQRYFYWTTLKMDGANSYTMAVANYTSTWRRLPVACNIHKQQCKYIKSRKREIVSSEKGKFLTVHRLFKDIVANEDVIEDQIRLEIGYV